MWEEKQTGRGTKITGRAIEQLQTPKARKLSTPSSKRKRLGSPITRKDCGMKEPIMGDDPIPIKLPGTKKRGGKVSSVNWHCTWLIERA